MRIHPLMFLHTSVVMFLESLGVSGLSTSYTRIQGSCPERISPQLMSRWLTSYINSTVFSKATTILSQCLLLQMAVLLCSLSMPKLFRALAKERTTKLLQPTSTRKHLALQPAHLWSLTSSRYAVVCKVLPI